MNPEVIVKVAFSYWQKVSAAALRLWGKTIFRYGLVAALSLTLLFYLTFVQVPINFPSGKMVRVPEGSTAKQAVAIFRDRHVVRSGWLLEKLILLRDGEGKVAYGDYRFAKPISVWEVAERVVNGRFELLSLRVTIPEGYTREDIANYFSASKNFDNFNKTEFLQITAEKEGYLFPDTYLFYSNADATTVANAMENNFKEKIALLADDIKRFGKTTEDVVTMASLLEREARTTESRQIIAGILWKRIKIGMPLQVDAAFNYVNGKNTFELSTKDLLIDSPYNTYRYKGLPKGPIANPGLEALKAAVTPISTNYLFYLSDASGALHYAKDFAAHKRNKALYIP